MITTERLILRRWRDADREAFAELCRDSEVMFWLGGVLTRQQADARIDGVEASFETRGHGRYLIERRSDGAFLGWCGIMPARDNLPMAGLPEMGWRLARAAWGQGYASEAAKAALDDGHTRLGLREIWAWTSPGNLRSQAVMDRIGLKRESGRDFDHPGQPHDSPLRRSWVWASKA
jgi:RimJ/RimL family protein N-acetyltransferase